MIGIAVDRDGTRAQASAWLARLQGGPLGEAELLAFDAWLDEGPANRAAYSEALGVWHEYEAAADAVMDELSRPAPRPAQGPAPRSAGRPAGRRFDRRWIFGAGGMAAAAAVTLALMPGLMTSTSTYATGKGQHRKIELADGSRVDLNAETKLSVTYGPFKREVALTDGDAIFDVAHDGRRAFTVEAGGRTVRVLGTQFEVRHRSGDLMVTVARGKVEVRPGAASPRTFTLVRGQRLEVSGEGLARLKTVDPQETFSWRTGRLVYRDQPLSEVVADLNRQFVPQIEIGDAALAQTPITGVIVLDDPEAIVARLSLMLPIRSVPSERGLLLLRK